MSNPIQLRLLWVLLFVATPGLAQDGILWKIESKTATSYLLGTIHSEDPRVLQLADTIKPQLDKSRSFTAELDLNLENSLTAAMAMLIQDGKELPGLIGRTRYQRCLTYMASYGVPEMMLRQLKPWAVMAQLSMPKPQTGLFLDRLLYDYAVEQQKPVYGLETYEEQIGVFEKLSLQQQIILLDETLENFPKLDQQLQQLIALYLKHDLSGLQRYSDSLMKSGSEELMHGFNQSLITDRNHRMVERMQARLQEGNAFIAVGALHLPGEQGILHLLTQRGYRITPVY
ncbi:MAG: TraB/GumN family protein [Gammaproteobacteria bacterium]|nr:TraB/GumN family protein [Gammaproteobacteria bacterium]